MTPIAYSLTANGVHVGNLFATEAAATTQRERMNQQYPGIERAIVPLHDHELTDRMHRALCTLADACEALDLKNLERIARAATGDKQ